MVKPFLTADIAAAPVPETDKNKAESLQALFAPLMERRRVPLATYRLQMHKGFGFRDAIRRLSYLAQLGITDCYTSPLLQATPGSTHGYDICNHNKLNPELGSESDYEAFVQELKTQKMGHVLDFVPNHMSVSPETNPWWADVLENGPSSPFAHYFDVDWDPVKPELKNKVLLPILGDQYGITLEKGELQIVFEEGSLYLRYYENRLPINPRKTPDVLRHNLETLETDLKDDSSLREFLSIMTELTNLPPSTEKDPALIAERQREKEVARERLARLVRSSPRIQSHILEAVKFFNGTPGQPESFNRLHDLLEEQAYRLASWRTASHEINYRRFFDINHLAGLRMEWQEVFAATHRLVFDLIGQGKILGLRLDHPDGLYDPVGYFDALQETYLEGWAQQATGEALTPEMRAGIRAWRKRQMEQSPKAFAGRPLYLVAEKILSTGENLPSNWALDGSSGYDFLNDMNRLFVDKRNATRFRELYVQFTGKGAPLDVVIYVCKRLIMTTQMASELNVLAHALNRISESDRRSRDFTLNSLRDALREMIACFPVYRTYITAQECSSADRQVIDRAIARAKRRNPAMEASIFQFVRDCLIPHDATGLSPEAFTRRIEFSMKFQQYTGPVQAKGLEDTAFYRYNLLLSLNEVGGDPGRFGTSIKEFHDLNAYRRKNWPTSLLATATHDTKRGEDARARLNILSEIPEEWLEAVTQWSGLVAAARTGQGMEAMPELNDEYLLFQTLIGAWSFDPSDSAKDLIPRLKDYLTKAFREAKLRTSWINPNDEYERAVNTLVDRLELGVPASPFVSAFEPFARRIAQWGAVNSLAQVVLKLTSPGVPDFYQGSELWDLSLVDPDNRRQVDYARRETLLREMGPWLDPDSTKSANERSATIRKWLDQWTDGRIKLYVTAAGLSFRRSHPDVFLQGDYVPLDLQGDLAENAVAFMRRWNDQIVLVVVPRLITRLTTAQHPFPVGEPSWGATQLILPDLPGLSYRELYTGRSITAERRGTSVTLPLAKVLSDFPVAILTPDSGSAGKKR